MGGPFAGARRRPLLGLRVWAAASAPLLLVPGLAALALAALARLLGYQAFPARAGDVLCRVLAGTLNSIDPLWYLTIGIVVCVPLCAVLWFHEPGAAFLLAYGSRRRAWAHRIAVLVALVGVQMVVLVAGSMLWSVVLGGSPSLSAPHSALAVWTASPQLDGSAPDAGTDAGAVLAFVALAGLGALALASAGNLLATLAGLPVALVVLLGYLVLVAASPLPWLPGACLVATKSQFFGAPDSSAVVQLAGSLLVTLASCVAGGYAHGRMDLDVRGTFAGGGHHA